MEGRRCVDGQKRPRVMSADGPAKGSSKADAAAAKQAEAGESASATSRGDQMVLMPSTQKGRARSSVSRRGGKHLDEEGGSEGGTEEEGQGGDAPAWRYHRVFVLYRR